MYRAEIFEEGGVEDAPEIFCLRSPYAVQNEKKFAEPISKILRFTITNHHLDAYSYYLKKETVLGGNSLEYYMYVKFCFISSSVNMFIICVV